jgi:endonuclease/exonuclease/phosphatase family metal-dependent hydrolase
VGGPELRLVSFNIKRGRRPADDVIDLPLLAACCAELEADVLALQEVVVGTELDSVAAVAEACGLTGVFGPAITLRSGDGAYGNALLVRGRIEDVEHVPFPQDTEPRAGLVATAAVGDTRWSIATAHLGLRGQALDELPELVARLVARPGPHALLGDLNLELAQVTSLVATAGLELAGGPPTFSTRRPRRRIDHVALGGSRVERVEVRVMPVSDHRALIVDVELASGAASTAG